MRKDGPVAAATCIHGFSPESCLICQTLQQAPPATKKRAGVPAPVRPDAVIAPRERQGPRLPVSLRVGGWLIVLAAVGVALFFVIGVIYAALRLVELAATALVCGWVGWKLGVHHGRREVRKSSGR